MSDTSRIENELRQIRRALERIADHVDPDGKRQPRAREPEDSKVRFLS